MESIKNKKVLISGASIAGFSAAWWMNNLGYEVTVVELAGEPRVAGGAVNIEDAALDAVKRMGIFEQLKSNRLNVELIEFKDAGDVTVGSMPIITGTAELSDNEIEIERDKFIGILYDDLKNDINFIFNNRIAALTETEDDIKVAFKNGGEQSFHLVFGCDGSHSGVRKLWFGPEQDYEHFLQAYFSITIVNKLLIKQKTMQMYNVPDIGMMLNSYKNKTDIIFCFYSEEQIQYDYRNIAQQRKIILDQFADESWRSAELLTEIQNSPDFYFDKFCQIKMPTWTKGRVALVGDAGYCASPAAGKGASLSVIGAEALADALQKHNGNYELAFADYNKELRPFIEEVQATAEFNVRENFIPRTEEAIQKRNKNGF
ncbi:MULTISPECIES: FAD-dependent monooxygenase [unclassified Mucilaginibacter]|uniref:FAD-dependent monooxygenase n=1 Tax=unclassified Mucilaginibacter TaxID=2617802 RepID=UPI002AC8E98C|nr:MULTISPECIES: FAD-dependent monooxygenase [unclassified Mucilaginibacter]MEB0260818.1 FAD-dependent monooxygenase [Mucilaginibacter sp. 10I4]MEB0279033.1 FAD-dependent monooxygenase [Mucilaginibacter sp. 10B2]MEB0299948.1 FAD-dependent monooxygenase [Mucilaginibacter sp. 5C4]WPX22211.1 FAD-dependent monooxygenase [Mucilaginibacter sp. 5C4]